MFTQRKINLKSDYEQILKKNNVSDLPSGSNPLVGLLQPAGRPDPPCFTIQSSPAHSWIHTHLQTQGENIQSYERMAEEEGGNVN